jgi:hypothetical protein
MESLNEKIVNLKKQQEQAKELFVKCQGGIEILQALIEEKENSKEEKKK